jgi:hypothetical protein
MTSSTSKLHDPLADGHIRLLELNLEHEHDIVGHLQPLELTSAPPYYALSYVCGNGPNEHEVTVNNVLFKVKPNLHAALRRLQSHFRLAGILRVWIWIDAICIDQDNADEKAKQIQGMHDIFSKAETVLILLGSVPEHVHMVLSIFSWIEIYTDLDPSIRSKLLERLEQTPEYDHREAWAGHPDSQLAGDIERLEYVTQRLRTRHKVDVQSLLAIKTLLERLELFGIWVGSDGRIIPPTDHEEKLKLAIDFPGLAGQLFHPNHQFWAGVYALSEIEWHQRVWTFQEVYLATNAQVFAEGLSVDWNQVVAPTIGLLRATENDTLFEKIDPEATVVGLPTRFSRHIWFWKWLHVGVSGDSPKMGSLLYTLITTRNRKSTIAKDKVYGLLAVIKSELRAQIPIDYRATDGKVFASAAKAALKDKATISLLWMFFDGDPSAMEDLPSWCPNFASMPGPLNLARHFKVPQAVQQQISASACYEHSPGFQTIRVNVLRLDSTANCVDVACPLANTGSQFSPPRNIGARHTFEEMVVHWLLRLRATFSDCDSGPVLPREVTAFLYGTSQHPSLVPFETFWETLNHMLLFAGPDLQLLRVCEYRRDWAEYRDTLTIISSQSGRYLFKTTCGEFGFSTRQPTPGNHVVLLPGSSCLHMLTEDCTQYCGCVSLPGMREDALLDLVNARENMWEIGGVAMRSCDMLVRGSLGHGWNSLLLHLDQPSITVIYIIHRDISQYIRP